MSCFLFALPCVITSELFKNWFTYKDVNRLDSSCSSRQTRAQFMTCISASTLVLEEIRVEISEFLDYVQWLHARSASVAGLSIPPLFLTEGKELVSAKNVARLKKSNMKDCSNLSDNLFQAIVINCRYLSDVHIGSDQHASWITDESLFHLSRSTTALKTFQLSQNFFVSDNVILSMCETNKSLLEVELRNCSNVGDRSLLALAKFCPSLQVLKLVNNKLIQGACLSPVLHSCPNLRELALIGYSAPLLDLRTPSLKNLAALTLGGFPEGADLRLGQFISRTPALLTLNLHDMKCLTDEEFLTLTEDLVLLSSLSLQSCPRLTAPGLQALIQRCPALLELSVTKCSITQSVVERLARSCPHLAALSLTWCLGVTDAALSLILAQDPLPPLTQINLNGCALVTHVTVRALAHFVPTLASLSVCYCPKISAEVVKEVSARHPALKIVHQPALFG